MKKRTLSMMLSVIMFLSCMSVSSFADEVTTDNEVAVTEQEQNESNNIVKSEDKTDNTGGQEESKQEENNLKEKTEQTEDETQKMQKSEKDDFSAKEKEWLEYLKENGLDGETEEDETVFPSEWFLDEDGIQKFYFNDENIFDNEDSDLTVMSSALMPRSKPPVKKRYTVLVLDISGSMRGTPMKHMKIAAKKFCDAVLKDKAENYIALIPYDDEVNDITSFTKDKDVLYRAIDKMTDWGGTNTNLGLECADDLLSTVANNKGTVKNIILLSDGMPGDGKSIENGKYSKADHFSYDYANACYETATMLKNKGYRLYTLGFFHSLNGQSLSFGRRFMKDLQNAGYYDVNDPNKLEFIFGEIANEITEVTGKFKYPGSVGNRDCEETYVYKDSYFKNSSYTYNQSLATMSLCLELSSWCSSDEKIYKKKSANAKALFKKIGFSDFAQNSFYDSKPTMDSIGAVAANKKITVDGKEYTLIALAVRGGGYESEWASNFTIGRNGYHRGFREARDNVASFLKQYIKDKGITGDIKLWITGYSRAGATANLVAGGLNDKSITLGSCRLKPEDMYTYTFEAPGYWKFRRFGKDKQLPHSSVIGKKESTLKLKSMKKYLNTYEGFSGEEYKIDEFSMKKINTKTMNGTNTKEENYQGRFLDKYVNLIARKYIKTRQNYVFEYQEGIRQFFRLLFEPEKEKSKKFKTIFWKKISLNLIPILKSTSDERVKKIKVILEQSLEEAGISGYDSDVLANVANVLRKLLFDMAKEDTNMTATAIANIGSIKQGHYPEICLAWMQSMDDNYETGANPRFSPSKNRIIRINCPVDVHIYEEDTLVGQIINDEPVEVDDYMFFHGFNSDGEKFAYICAEIDCTVKIIATGDGTVSYTVQEESLEDGIARIVNYFDIPIQKGTVLTATLPAYTEEDLEDREGKPTATKYTLWNTTENKEILATNDLSGEAAKQYKCYIDVQTEQEQQGLAWGRGERVLGGYALVSAFPFEGYQFDGWYEDGKKVSEDLEYRVKADKNRTLIAKFQKDDTYQKPDTSSESKDKQDKVQQTPELQTDSKNTEQMQAPFTDIRDHWAKDSIQYLWEKDIVRGYADNTFCPDSFVIRAEVVQLLIQAKNLDKATYRGIFSDVKANDWFADAVQTAVNHHLVEGYPDKTFRPNRNMTRAEWITVLQSLQNNVELTSDEEEELLSRFKDKDSIPYWARKAVAGTVQSGLISGFDNRIYADRPISRAEIAVTLHRLLYQQRSFE